MVIWWLIVVILMIMAGDSDFMADDFFEAMFIDHYALYVTRHVYKYLCI